MTDQDEAVLALLAKELPPVITEPEDLIAQGLMPQIPYEKLERMPDGWERIGAQAARSMTRRSGQAITGRHLTLEQGRAWPDHDDPDRPQVVAWRLALIGAQGHEGGDADQWIIITEKVGGLVSAHGWTRDRAEVWATYGRAIEAIERARRD